MVDVTGIERLRELAGEHRIIERYLTAATIDSIADQIESEQGEAETWVREHGGLGAVKEEWRSRVPYDRYERRRQRLLGHIAECEDALGRRNWRIEELEGRIKALTTENAELRKRAMPEGYEWPRFEDGEPVRFGDAFAYGDETFYIDSVQLLRREFHLWATNGRVVTGSNGERCERPEPKVLDADGAEIRVGDTVYEVDTGEQMWVCALPKQGEYSCVKLRLANGMSTALDPYRLTHRAPVLAADGRPLREGETVWDVDGRGPLTVWRLPDKSDMHVSLKKDGTFYYRHPEKLTHERPDSWERIEEDAENVAKLFDNFDADASEDMRAIVRRCRALAERERGQ